MLFNLSEAMEFEVISQNLGIRSFNCYFLLQGRYGLFNHWMQLNCYLFNFINFIITYKYPTAIYVITVC